MKNTKGFLAAIALAVLVSALQFAGSDFSSKSLQTNVPGYSIPVNTTYSSFGCYSPGSWSSTVWCQTYGSTYASHVTEANKHSGIIAMFKRNLSYYGDFYVVGSYGSTAVGKNGQTYYAGAIVECPAGATVQYHSSSHHLYSPSLGEGFYDGSGHYWCELNGVATDPVVKAQLNGIDYSGTDRDKLFKFEFPDGIKKYTSYNDSTNVSSSGLVKCPDGAAAVGPFTSGNQYTNQYWVKEAGKRDYYRCYDSTKGIFANAVTDSIALASPYSSILSSYFRTDNVKSCDSTYTTCQPSCAAGDATCGGANTVGAATQACASNTYWCQTTDVNYRYCSADATCTATEMTPPAPTWTINPPTFLRILGTKMTGFAPTESVPVAASFAATGTNIPYGQTTLTVQIAQDTSFATAWLRPSSTGNVFSISSDVYGSIDNFPATGTFYWRAKMALGNQESAWTSAPYPSFVVCAADKTWNGTSCVTPAPTLMGTIFKDGQYVDPATFTLRNCVAPSYWMKEGSTTSGARGFHCMPSMANNTPSNYDYPPTPCVGTVWAGSDTTGVSADYCATSKSTTTTTTTPTDSNASAITLNGTIFKDGQYVDPATSTLRNCVSPSYWMKETPTTSGARGFHCMPNTPGYTLTNDHYPPTTCTGTLWAGSGTTVFSDDYCATSKDSSITPPIPTPTPGQCSAGEKCSSGSWCNNGSKCHYPDGTLTCTSSWGESCPSGTKVCSPTDTNCREPLSVSPVVDGAWCSNAMSCYSKDGKELFCQLAPVMTTPAFAPGSMSCNDPKYPSSCRPGDKYCTEIGATNSNSGAYCAGGGKQCYKGSDLLCVGYSESCPADTGACKASDVANGCTEPGKYGTGSNAWCGGGGSVQCYKNDGTGVYCGQIAGGSMDPTAWETFACPADTGRCRKDDKYCLGSIGAKGPSGSWCAVGMSRNEKDGTVTCVSSKDYMPVVVPPVVDECIRVTTIAYDPKTNDCKQFANTCNVPSDWTFVTDGRICKDGKLTSIDVVIGGDDKSLIDFIEGYRQRIREYDLQLNKLPAQVQSQAEVAAVKVLVNDSAQMLKGLLQKFPTKSETDRQYLRDKIAAFNKDTFVNIESRMNELRPYMDFASLRDELRRDLERYKFELGKIVDTTSEYYVKLNSMVEKLGDLLDSAEKQTGTVLDQLLVAIKDTRNQLEILVAEQRREETGNFLQDTIDSLVADEARFDAFIEEKDLGESKISYLFARFSALIEKIQKENLAGNSGKVLWSLVDEAKAMRDRLAGWLETYGLKRTEEIDVENVLKSYVDEAVAKIVEEMFGDFKNSLSLMLDEALQPLVLKVSELADKIKTLSDTVAQSVSNLQYVVEKHREAVIEAKTRIIEQIESLEAALTASSLGNFTVQGMNDVMNTVATTTWCDDVAERVEANINTVGLTIESNEFEAADLNTLKTNVEQWRVDNREACYTGGYTPGRDVPMEEWYYVPAQFNFERGWMNGYRDAHGNLIGQFGPGNSTLKIEAVKMMMNLFGVERGDYSIPPGVAGVPNWPNAEGQNEANTYVNGALKAGVNLVKYGALDKPITRAETAGLIYDMMVASGSSYFKPADVFTHVQEYNDSEKILNNKEFAGIIEALTDLGIFKGSSVTGNFDPYNNLVRSEFATLNQRIDETFGLDEVAIGEPDGN